MTSRYSIKLKDTAGNISYYMEDGKVKRFVSFYDCQKLIAKYEKEGLGKGEIIVKP